MCDEEKCCYEEPELVVFDESFAPHCPRCGRWVKRGWEVWGVQWWHCALHGGFPSRENPTYVPPCQWNRVRT